MSEPPRKTPSQKKTPPGPEVSPSAEGRSVVHQRTEVRAEFQGPIPPPGILQQYEQVIPGAAERILAMAEKQAEHRMALEKSVIESGIKSAASGIKAAAYIATLFTGISVVFAIEQYPAYAIATAGATLAGLVGVNIQNAVSRRKERVEKAKIMTEDDESRRARKSLPPSKK